MQSSYDNGNHFNCYFVVDDFFMQMADHYMGMHSC